MFKGYLLSATKTSSEFEFGSFILVYRGGVGHLKAFSKAPWNVNLCLEVLYLVYSGGIGHPKAL